MPDTTPKQAKTPKDPNLTTRGTLRKQTHRKANASEVHKVVSGIHPAVRRWQERQYALGSTQRMAIFELHVRQGKSITDIALMLGIGVPAVCNHWAIIKAELAEKAPSSDVDFISLREELAARLRATIDETHSFMPVKDVETGEEIMMGVPTEPKMLAIRLKAIEQLSKLYGVNMEREEAASGPPPYEAPEAIGEMVKARLLEIHGQGSSVAFKEAIPS